MEKLVKFYKIYAIVLVALITLASVTYRVVNGATEVGFGGMVALFGLLLWLPIFVYGTFVYLPSRIYKKFQSTKEKQRDFIVFENTAFEMLYYLCLFVLAFVAVVVIKGIL